MIGSFNRFDMVRKPNLQWRVLTPITWLLSFPKAFAHKARIVKTEEVKNLKPPYFLLCSHNSFMDFMIMTKAIFPYRANYIVAIDGFIGMEWLLRAVGGIGTRKFTTNVDLVKNMLHVRDKGAIVVLFPEARYSLCGTSSILPDSLGKMVRRMNVPVATLVMHGHHVNSPFWNIGSRKVKPVEADMKLLFTQEETQELSIGEINDKLGETLKYDDFAWQKRNGVIVRKKDRAERLCKVLYQCPSCNAEYKMTSNMHTLRCSHCGKIWEMSELGELRAQDGTTEFSHIPDWYEWQRANVRREVEDGEYSLDVEVRVESLPNAKGFVEFSEAGNLTHNMDGFTLSGVFENKPFSLHWAIPSLYSCHIEYDYKRRGDCIDLSKNDDTFYLFPKGNEFAVTKIALATEELYNFWKSIKAPPLPAAP